MSSNLRQKQSELLAQDSVHSSYVDNSCYIDESSIKSSSVDQALSSVKKHRKAKHHHLGGHQAPQRQHTLHERAQQKQMTMGQSPAGLRRSNSEIYVKNTEMQNEADALFVPIMYAMEQSQSLQ